MILRVLRLNQFILISLNYEMSLIFIISNMEK
jgi:hypothetical protein